MRFIPRPKRLTQWLLKGSLAIVWALVWLFIGMLSLAFVFKEDIKQAVLTRLGKDLNGKLVVQQVDLDVWQHWPQLTVRLRGATLYHTAQDAEHFGIQDGRMAHIEDLSLSLSMQDVLNGHYRLRHIGLQKPTLHLVCDAKGKWNYEALLGKLLAPQPTDSSARTDVALHLDKLRIVQARVLYHNLRTQHHYQLDSLDLNLAGSFVTRELDLRLSAAAHVSRMQLGKVSLLPGKHIGLSCRLQADTRAGRIAIRNGVVRLDKLQLSASGTYVTAPIPAIDVQAGTDAELADILYMLPHLGVQAAHPVSARGKCRIQARYHGPIMPQQMPLLDASLHLQNGTLAHTGIRQAALQQLHVRLRLHMNPNNGSRSFISLDTLRGMWGGSLPLAASCQLTDIHAPRIRATLETEAPLSQLAVLAPALAQMDKLEGSARLQLTVQGLLPDEAAKATRLLHIQGRMTLQEAGWQPVGLAVPLKHLTGEILFDERGIHLPQLLGNLGDTPWRLSGRSANLWAWLLGEQPLLEMQARLQVPHLDVDQLMSLESPGATPQPAGTAAASFAWEQLPPIRWELALEVDKLHFGQMQAQHLRAHAKLEPPVLKLTHLALQAFGGQLTGDMTLVKQHCESNLRLYGVSMGQFFKAFPQLAEYTVIGPYLDGKLSAEVSGRAALDGQLRFIPASVVADGRVQVQDASLTDFPLIEEMSGVLRLKRFRNITFRDASTRFGIRNEHFWLDTTTVFANDMHMKIYGGHSLSGQLNYHLMIQAKGVLGNQNKPNNQNKKNSDIDEWITETETQAEDAGSHFFLAITGTTEAPRFKLDTQAMRQKMRQDIRKEGQEWKQAWQGEKLPSLPSLGRKRKAATPAPGKAGDWIEEVRK
ncbi:MAG: AsmA family protein [Bacteroidetes bacterium]|nr:AsmA family protein [Bacteroidota bacterium]